MSAGKVPNFPISSQKIWELINSDNDHRGTLLCDYNPIFIEVPKFPSFFIRSMGESIKYRNRGNITYSKKVYMDFWDFWELFRKMGLNSQKLVV